MKIATTEPGAQLAFPGTVAEGDDRPDCAETDKYIEMRLMAAAGHTHPRALTLRDETGELADALLAVDEGHSLRKGLPD